jgi:transposase
MYTSECPKWVEADDMDSSFIPVSFILHRNSKRPNEESEMNNSVIGLDIAKSIFHLFYVSANGKPVKKKLKRSELLSYIANMPASLIGMEACGGAHHWAREFTKLGHEIVLLNARFVKAFVIGNKNDFNDAEAIYTAVTRPNKRTVVVKNLEQQEMQMLHRLRQDLIYQRAALTNRIRGFLSELGIVLPQGVNQVRKRLPLVLQDAENALPSLSRELFAEMYDGFCTLDDNIKAQERRINRLCQQNTLSRRYLEVPGIGPITATIMASDISDGKGYTKSRDYAASLGVVPRQHSSGDKQVLMGISKRGNRYLRTLLIHGARSVVKHCSGKSDPLNRWLQALVERRGFNKAAVALANKNARVLWAMARQDKTYEAAAA